MRKMNDSHGRRWERSHSLSSTLIVGFLWRCTQTLLHGLRRRYWQWWKNSVIDCWIPKIQAFVVIGYARPEGLCIMPTKLLILAGTTTDNLDHKLIRTTFNGVWREFARRRARF
ncbi:hypothetical protein FB446DRAFT_704051 [Lentinula raphanica]|nr:hypothetical protein FB446DRAFT_704051 [Lentinula raphanica]